MHTFRRRLNGPRELRSSYRRWRGAVGGEGERDVERRRDRSNTIEAPLVPPSPLACLGRGCDVTRWSVSVYCPYLALSLRWRQLIICIYIRYRSPCCVHLSFCVARLALLWAREARWNALLLPRLLIKRRWERGVRSFVCTMNARASLWGRQRLLRSMQIGNARAANWTRHPKRSTRALLGTQAGIPCSVYPVP